MISKRLTAGAVGAVLALSLISGCSTQSSNTAGSAGGSSPVTIVEGSTQAATTWHDISFYERTYPEIEAAALDMGLESVYTGYDSEYDLFEVDYQGTVDDSPSDSIDTTVLIFAATISPDMKDDTEGTSVDDIADGSLPDSFGCSMASSVTNTDDYAAVAADVADTFGLSGMGDMETLVDGLYQFSGTCTFNGEDTTWTLMFADSSVVDTPITSDDYPTLVTLSVSMD